MTEMRKKIDEAMALLESREVKQAEIGIILGTGLGKLADEIEVIAKVPYAEIPHFPVSTVETHDGQLILGKVSGKTVLAMQGRFHF